MSAPEQAVALLKERLSAAAEPDPQRIPRLIADLDSNRFAVRQRAWEELKKLGQQAEPALQAVLKGLSSLEMRRRVELL